MDQFWDILGNVGFFVWLAGALFFLVYLGVFSPKPLRAAPARESLLSLPIVGAVIVFYLIMQVASALAAVGLGALPASELAPAAQQVAASQPASSSQPASAARPAATAPVFSDADRTVAVNAIAIVCALLTAVPVLLVLPRLFKQRSAGWGLHPRQLPAGVLKGLGGFFIVYPLLLAFAMGLDALYRQFHHAMSEHATFQAMDQHLSVARQILLCFTAIVVAPVSEELFFRGILQTTLIQYGCGFIIPQFMRPSALPTAYSPPAIQRWAAILLTSLAFASLHQYDQAPIIFVLALGLGYVYERTGNLWAPIVLHLAFNATNITTYLNRYR